MHSAAETLRIRAHLTRHQVDFYISSQTKTTENTHTHRYLRSQKIDELFPGHNVTPHQVNPSENCLEPPFWPKSDWMWSYSTIVPDFLHLREPSPSKLPVSRHGRPLIAAAQLQFLSEDGLPHHPAGLYQPLHRLRFRGQLEAHVGASQTAHGLVADIYRSQAANYVYYMA